MGTGKTTVGKILASKLSKDFIEMDNAIEEQEGLEIKDIFLKSGEPYFRSLEKKLLKKISSQSDLVVSCGGGLVCDLENLKILQSTGQVFSLTASPEIIFERLKKTRNRPLLNVKDPLVKIKELLNLRKNYYQKAGLQIDTDNLAPPEVSDFILGVLKDG